MKRIYRIFTCCLVLSLCTAGLVVAKKSGQEEDRKKQTNTSDTAERKAEGKSDTNKASSSANNKRPAGGLGTVARDEGVAEINATQVALSGPLQVLQSRTGEQINWQVLSGGGGLSTTTALQLFSVIGQTAADESASGTLRLQHGFLQNFGSQGCCVGVTGNIDCDPGSVVDIADLTVLIDYLFISLAPLCCREEGNIDGDTQGVVDIADLTR